MMHQILNSRLCIILLTGLFVDGCSGTGTTVSTTSGSPTAVIAISIDSKNNVYAATTGNGTANPNGSVYMTSPSGAVLNNTSWISLASSVPDGSRTSAMVISNDNVYVGTNGQGANPGNVYLKTQNIPNWSLVGGSGVPDAGVVSGLAVANGNVYAASTGSGRYAFGHVYLSNGGTSSWVAVGSNNFARATRVHAVAVGNNGSVYAGVNSLLNGAVAGGNVYVAATPTSIWQLVGGGAMPNNKFVIALTTDVNNNVYAGTSSINQSGGVVYISNNGSGVWTQFATPMPDGGTINKIIVDSQKDIYTASGGGNVYVANNGSATWNVVGGGSPDNTPVYAIYVSTSGDVYAATKNGMVYFSSGGTRNWVLIAGGRVPL